MTNLILIFVLHGDALDEFPRHRQEMLDLGKGCWKPAKNVTHQGTTARALKLYGATSIALPCDLPLHSSEWYLKGSRHWLRELVLSPDCRD